MILKKEDKILVVHRRLFEADHARFFTGVVEAYEQGVAKVKGHTWTKDPHTTTIVRKEDARTKIISLLSGTLFVYQLPNEVDLSSIQFENDNKGRFLLKNKKKIVIDLSETVFEEA